MTGVELIAEERQRQVEEEGWSAEHDDGHQDGALSLAAICYAAPEPVFVLSRAHCGHAYIFNDPWPWDDEWDKREQHSKLRRLTIAGALIAAEIDRLQREHGARKEDA